MEDKDGIFELLRKDEEKENMAKLKLLLTVKRKIKETGFEEFMNQMIAFHDDAYKGSCLNKGRQPSPNDELSGLFLLAKRDGNNVLSEQEMPQAVAEIASGPFPADIVGYEGYFFILVFGQGVAYEVWKNEECLIHLV